MRCRRIDKDTGNIVWFGVKDVTQDSEGNNVAIFVSNNNKHDNYASGSEGVSCALRQSLSVLKNELWYDFANGMPLIDKIKNKAIIDAYVVKTILANKDVISIQGFESEQDRTSYSAYVVINTVYGQIELSI